MQGRRVAICLDHTKSTNGESRKLSRKKADIKYLWVHNSIKVLNCILLKCYHMKAYTVLIR